ncbi:Do family serine endopeptidase [Fulvivirga kasyanovii]|uniref:Do family serine endopeptidase n=1 Tax=Fulvivirga kasyanovii TaxID=396812 RepID=A0ABW9RQS6_9BACT|nr:Do family serine endopeptidase [Fulvivirga kasyanovii]MTI25639.1 Do family serine endopeptidase [Fulvivirga kasyanovii]
MKKFSALIMAAVLGSALTIGSVYIFNMDNENRVLKIEHVDGTPAVKTAYSVNKDGELVPLDFTGAAEKVMPAVVHIRSTQTGNYSTQNRQQIPEQFRDFFGPFLEERGGRQPMPRMGSGSGVIINSKGYIVTNNHVIANADDLEVTLNDNRSYKAKVIGADPTTDIALIKIEADKLSSLSFVNSDDVRVGEWVLAVGNPFNLNSTVTAGIVSAKGRSIGIIGDNNAQDSVNSAIEAFIQTDAAVNPGNSGGALVDLGGNLIGINTAIASPTGSYSGYSFAVPSNIVSKVVEDLMAYGTVQRGWLGVQIRNINSQFAREQDLNVISGAYIDRIDPKSGAKEAGIEEGDVIVSIDGRDINNTTQLIGYIGSKRPGDKINVTVNRSGKEITYDVTLKNREGNTEVVKKEREEILTILGAELENVDRSTLKRLDISSGVKVKSLTPGKIRKSTDMRPGFIITKIDGQPVKSKDEVVKILEKKEGGILIEGVYEDTPGTYYYGLGLS